MAYIAHRMIHKQPSIFEFDALWIVAIDRTPRVVRILDRTFFLLAVRIGIDFKCVCVCVIPTRRILPIKDQIHSIVRSCPIKYNVCNDQSNKNYS